MPILIKQPLSESNSGMPITVTATSPAAAELIHRVQATATNVFELVTLWGNGRATGANVDMIYTATNGATEISGQRFLGAQTVEVSPQPALILNQIPMTGTDSALYVYATATGGFHVWGHVDRIATG